MGEAVGEGGESQEQLPHSLQEREVCRQPGEKRHQGLQSFPRLGEISLHLSAVRVVSDS